MHACMHACPEQTALHTHAFPVGSYPFMRCIAFKLTLHKLLSDVPVAWHRYFLGPGQTVQQIMALGLSSRKNLCVHPSVAGISCNIPEWSYAATYIA